MTKTSVKQKIGLVIGGLVFAVVILEIGLRLGGFLILYRRDRDNQARLAEKSEFRIMCVGESTTYCGNHYSSYPRQLEGVLNEKGPGMKYVVINKGKPGCSTAYILNKLESWLEDCRPDMVIAMMGINDGMGETPGVYQPDKPAGKVKLFSRNLRTWKVARFIWRNVLIKLREMEIIKARPQEVTRSIGTSYFPGDYDGYDYDIEMKLQSRLRKAPRDTESYIELGSYYLGRDMYKEAAEMFNKALEIDPENDKANVGLARYYLNQHSGKVAKRLCQTALKKNPFNDEAWLVAGLVDMSKHKYGPAADKLTEVLEMNPSNDEALAARAYCYWKRKKFPEAREGAAKAIEINPSNRWAYGILGLCYKRRGDYQAALEVYQKVIKAHPYSHLAYTDMGQIYQKLGKPEVAETYFQKARSLSMSTYNRDTFNNYNRMKKILDQSGIQLVGVQYPVRNIGPLKKMLGSHGDIIFVDNEAVFKEALNRTDYNNLFEDRFGIDFGHCTAEGNELLAENIARVLFEEYFNPKLEYMSPN